jgi:hypothetical protein
LDSAAAVLYGAYADDFASGLTMSSTRDTEQTEEETNEYVRAKTDRMLAPPIYRRLRAIVSSWDREERGKARVIAGAGIGFVALALVATLFGAWRPEYAGYSFVLGFPFWVALVSWLMYRHLGRRSGSNG